MNFENFLNLNRKFYNKNSLLSPADLISGTSAGILVVLLGQPFDLIKVRLQTNRHLYKSNFDCINELYQKEGIFSFYKGTLSPLIGVSFCVAIEFSANEFAKRYFQLYHLFNGNNNYKLTVIDFMISGGFSGLCTALPTTPVELIRIKLQGLGNKYRGTIDCLNNIFQTYGFKGLFQGLGITILRDVPANIVYFGLYESLMQIAESKYSDRKNIPNIVIMSYGGLSGILMWLLIFPIDVIKTNIQTDYYQNRKTIINSFKYILNKNGFKGFFNGLIPCLLRAPMINAVTFFTFEKVKRFLNK